MMILEQAMLDTPVSSVVIVKNRVWNRDSRVF